MSRRSPHFVWPETRRVGFPLAVALAFVVVGQVAHARGRSSNNTSGGVLRVLPSEHVLIGGPTDLFSAGPRKVVAGHSLGSFESNASFTVGKRPAFADALWFGANETMRDGMVRVRLLLNGGTPDFSVIVRAEVDPKDVERFSGLGLSFEKERVLFHRWTAGLVRENGIEARIRNLKGRRAIEIALTLAGPHVVAVIHDADSLEVLASVSITDYPAAAGHIGLRFAKKHPRASGVESLSYFDAAVDVATVVPVSGQRRWAWFRAEDERLVPKDLRKNVQRVFAADSHRTKARGGGERVLVGAPLDLARARRAGVRLEGETADFGFKWLDRDTRAVLESHPKRTRAVVPAGYADAAVVEQTLKAYAAKYPAITKLVQIGKTRQGRALWALKISDHAELAEDEPAVLLNAGHHGLELISTTVMLDAIDQLLTRYRKHRQTKRWVDALEIWCIPLVNPDGADLFMHHTTFGGRKNGRELRSGVDAEAPPDANQGVDLNRNYPFHWGTLGEVGSRSWPAHYRYRGDAPESEPETKAMVAFAREQHFAASISYHSWATRVLVPYTIPGVKNRPGDEAWTVAEEMAAQMPKSQPSRRQFKARRLLYPVDGTDQDWFRHETGTLALLVEVALHNPAGALRKSTTVASRASWQFLLERAARGPILHVTVHGPDGKPVVAEVRVKESLPINGEIWTTRASDGALHRMLSTEGTYTVDVIAGDQKIRRRVRVRQGQPPLKIILPR